LHKYSNKLHCHYCGSTYPKIVACPACGHTEWTERNFGTQKIEEQLESDFSGANVARMDVDAVKGKHAHDALIRLFEQHRVDILVGTQMVVKGLDFDKVNLVGILDADGLLSFSDFRASERAFQLMEQVSGRAGRKEAGARVLIQTSNPMHPILQLLVAHDFKRFYHAEIQVRKDFYYPPFCRLLNLQLKHKDERLLKEASHVLAASLRQDFGENIIGPAAPVIARVRNQYVMEIMIKLKKEMGARHKKVIRHHINLLLSEKQYHAVHVIADVDPV
jgi:primosomal protein N' (replication factor Y)